MRIGKLIYETNRDAVKYSPYLKSPQGLTPSISIRLATTAIIGIINRWPIRKIKANGINSRPDCTPAADLINNTLKMLLLIVCATKGPQRLLVLK
jgi:hypothetical protein